MMADFIRIDAGAIVSGPMPLPNKCIRPDGQRVSNYNAPGNDAMWARDGWLEIPGERPAVEWWQTVSVALDAAGNPVWVVADREIAEVQAERIGNLWQWHDALLAAGCPVTVDGVSFRVDCERDDVMNWISGERLLDLSGMPSIGICDYDNAVREVSAGGYKSMIFQVGAYVGGLMSRRWALRERIHTATSVADIVGIDFDAPTTGA